MLSFAFDNVQNREMKSESGFSLAMARQPLHFLAIQLYYHKKCIPATRANWRWNGKSHTITRYQLHGFCYTIMGKVMAWQNSCCMVLAMRHGFCHVAWVIPCVTLYDPGQAVLCSENWSSNGHLLALRRVLRLARMLWGTYHHQNGDLTKLLKLVQK